MLFPEPEDPTKAWLLYMLILKLTFFNYLSINKKSTFSFQMRIDMVRQIRGQTYLTVKQHYDDMVRKILEKKST